MRSIWMGAAAMALAACGDRAPADSGDAPSKVAVPAAAASAPTAGRTMASETRTFRDWIVTCDNGNACVAFGPAVEGVGWTRVPLDAGPDARPTMAVGFWPDTGDQPPGPLTVAIDSVRFIADGATDDESGQFLREPAKAVAALADSRAISVSASGQSVALSPSGAAAAMLWIDERQGRLGTVTALVRKGPRPAAMVPAPPPLPVIVAAPAISQTGFGDSGQTLPAAVEATSEAKECRAETDFSPAIQKEVRSARLDSATELWGLPCFIGAYNTGIRYFLTGPGGSNPRVIRFPTTGAPSDTLTNAEYSPGDRMISQFAKGRGVGDCGVASTWVWTGRAFVLEKEAEMTECWGVASDLWPTTWRSR